MGKQIFISYKSEDKAEADIIKSKIEKSGFSCWMAPDSIPVGSSYAAEIEDAINDCKALVLLFTERAMNSQWVEREVDRAINQKKLVIPLKTEEFSLNSQFRYYLTNVQFYDAYRDPDSALSQIIEQLKCTFKPDLPIYESTPDNSDGSEHKEKRESKNEKKKHKKAGANRKKIIKYILPIVLSAILFSAVVTIIMVLVGKRSVVIADNKVSVKTSSINVSDFKLTDEDLSNINKLKNLSFIRLTNCELSNEDVKKIDAFKSDYSEKLYEVNLSGNKEITNFEFLKNVEGLSSLDVSETGITDFSGLDSNFAYNNISIATLILDGCPISSFEELNISSGNYDNNLCFSFNRCDLDDNKLTELGEKLAVFDSITSFSLNNNPKITSLAFLKSCSDLTELNVSETGITDFNGLENCLKLEKLNAKNCSLLSLKGLENTTVLQEVDLGNNDIKDITLLKQSEKTLQYLFLEGNKLFDSGDDSGNGELELISIGENPNNSENKNPETIGSLNNLIMLDLSQNCLDDSNTAFLEGKKSIKWLRLCGNKLRSFKYLKELESLEFLDLSDNQLSSFDFSALSYKTKSLYLGNNSSSFGKIEFPDNFELKKLDLYGNTFNSIGGITSCESMAIDFSYSADYESFNSVVKAVKLVDCPLNKQLKMSSVFNSGVEFLSEEDYEKYTIEEIENSRNDYLF